VGGYAGAGALLCWLFGLIGIKCGRAVGSQMARSDLRLCAAWARSGRFRLGAMVLVGLLVGAGCSDGGEESGLPEITDVPTTSASPSGSPTWTPEQQAVIDAVTAYGKTVDAISAGAPVEMNKIRSVAADPWATQLGKNLLQWKALKLHLVGTLKITIRSVEVQSRSATVVECLDPRKQYYVSDGPKPTRATKPQDPAIFTASLVRSGSRWLVTASKKGKAC
jgi:hypothetical protein